VGLPLTAPLRLRPWGRVQRGAPRPGQRERKAGFEIQGEPFSVPRAALWAPSLRRVPARRERATRTSSVPGRAPGTQGDCMICRRRCRAHGPLEIFRNRISPVPRGCVSSCICACRCRYLGGCSPQAGGGGPQLFWLPHGHAPRHPLLLARCLAESGARQRGHEQGEHRAPLALPAAAGLGLGGSRHPRVALTPALSLEPHGDPVGLRLSPASAGPGLGTPGGPRPERGHSCPHGTHPRRGSGPAMPTGERLPPPASPST